MIEAWYREPGTAWLLYGTALHRVFLKLLEGQAAARVTDAKPYLFATLRHRLLNEARRTARFTVLDEQPWFHAHPEELALRTALATLPEDQREVVVMRVWGGLTFAQVAEVAGISANAPIACARKALGLGRLNVLHAFHRETQGDRAGALERIMLGLRFSRHVAMGGPLFSALAAKSLMVAHLRAVEIRGNGSPVGLPVAFDQAAKFGGRIGVQDSVEAGLQLFQGVDGIKPR